MLLRHILRKKCGVYEGFREYLIVRRLKRFFHEQVLMTIKVCFTLIFVNDLFAATLQVGASSIVLMAGQTVEVPLYSSKPISSDLTAKGLFQSGDVSLTPGPGCHLSAHGCTLRVTAAPNSRNYITVPIVLSESGASNKPVFFLSVTRPGEPLPARTKLPEVVSTPLVLLGEVGNELTLTFTNTTFSALHNLTVGQLPNGVNSSICPVVAPGVTCTLKLVVHAETEPGDSMILLQSDQGIVQYRILSITLSKVIVQKQASVLPSKPEKIFTSGNLSAEIIPHEITSAFYTSSSNGPVYQMIQVTNNSSTVTLDTPVIDGAGAASFSIDTNSADYAGAPVFCNNAPTLATGDHCLIIITSTLGDPTSTPAVATLTISDGVSADTLTFDLTDTTYVYAAGGFNTLGNASVSGGDLLARCTAGTCSNALQGTSGNNYATSNASVGQWINALIVTSTGNVIIGGVFGAIGGATSGALSGTAALLAQCIPGSVTGSACFNQMGTLASNPYAFNHAYINAITKPFLISSSNFIAIGGDFNQIRGVSVSSGGRMISRCPYSGALSNQNCSNYLSSAKFANNAIAALNTLGATSGVPLINVAGLFTQVAGYPSSVPSSGTTFARCTNGVSGTCSQGMSSNPNNSILGMSDDGTYLYMGGTLTQAGGYSDSSGGYPLIKCTPASITTCANALADSNDANGYIEGLVYSGGNLYVGGTFTTIGGATPVNNGNMLAVCSPGGTCSNFVTDTNPYASGEDWGGGIFAIAVGNQTSITLH